MSDDEEPLMGEPSQLTQTEPEVYKHVRDIFGDSDSDGSVKGGGDGSDNGLEDSDDDDAGKKTSRLKKGKALAPKKKSKEDKESKKKSKKDKKRKNSDKSDGEKDKSKRSKREKHEKAERQSGTPGQEDDGDEYDSDDVVANAADDKFLADEDDNLLAGVMSEYNEETQHFDDERPGKSSKKGKSGGGGAASSGSGGRATDIFTQTLQDMKKKKVAEISDPQKQQLATDLLKLMDSAGKRDEIAFEKKEPALNKLNLLKKVQDMVGIKAMQNSLLDYDILGVLSDWIQPKADGTLPSHTLRTAVYHMLSILPALPDHLKRKQPTSQRTIGMTVMALFKHKQETRENKILLKSVIEKWSRPIYGKTSDAHSSTTSSNVDLQEVIRQELSAQAAASRVRGQNIGLSLDDSLSKKSEVKDVFASSRARTPYSAGFLYTARPESKVVVNRESLSSSDEARKKMLKKMQDVKGSNRSGTGRKENLTSMDMEKTGRNKA